MTSVKVPYDMKDERAMGVRGGPPGKFFLLHPFVKYYIRKHPLNIKIRPSPDRKEQLHLLIQSYLPTYRFHCRFERLSNTKFFIVHCITSCTLKPVTLLESSFIRQAVRGKRRRMGPTLWLNKKRLLIAIVYAGFLCKIVRE